MGGPLALVIMVLIPVGLGFWCMAIFRGKGRSAVGGFFLGLGVAFVSPLVGLVVTRRAAGPAWIVVVVWAVGVITVLAVSYGLSTVTSRAAHPQRPGGLPPVALAQPALQPPALIATFGPTTGWVGRAITYDYRGFVIEGVGGTTPQQVLAYADQGHLTWASAGMRAWVASVAVAGGAPFR
jgi:predicted permease